MPSSEMMETPGTSKASSESLGENIASLMRDWSMECTLPKAADFDALREHVPPDSRIYLSALPDVPPEKLVEIASDTRAAGFEPVPHVAVRNYRGGEEVREILHRFRDEADVRRVLVIAGDRGRPRGPFASSLQLIESGLLQEAGIASVDIAGYPDGHPKIAHEDLMKALHTKIHVCRANQLEARVVTQFSFDAKALMSWLMKIRFDFPDLPISIGLAGPATTVTLFKYALHCGVRATARGLGRGLSLIGKMNGAATPLRMVTTLANGWPARDPHPFSLHFFSFGGVRKTASWGRSLARGEIELEKIAD